MKHKWTYQLAQDEYVPAKTEAVFELVNSMQENPNHVMVDTMHKTAPLKSQVYRNKENFLDFIEMNGRETVDEGRKLNNQKLSVLVQCDDEFKMGFYFNIYQDKVRNAIVFSTDQYWTWNDISLTDMWGIIVTQIDELDTSITEVTGGVLNKIKSWFS